MTIGEISTAETVLVLTMAGGAVRWWYDRRDARSALSTAVDEANQTIAQWERTDTASQARIADLEQDRDRLERRVAHLESLLYAGGGS